MNNIGHPSACTAHDAAVAVLDRDGVIVEINDAWRRFALSNGYRDDSFGLGESYLRHCGSADTAGCDADDAQTVSAGLRAVLAGDRAHFTFDYNCNAAGEARWFRLVAVPRSFAVRDGAIVAHIPVTREKLNEIELRDAQNRLSEIYRIADIGDFEYFPKDNRSRLSPPVRRMWVGFEESGGSYRQFFDTVHPDDRERVRGQISDASWTRLKLDYRLKHADGDVRYITTTMTRELDDEGQAVRVFGLHHDVTKRHLAQERLNRLFEASVDVLCIISFAGYFKRVNPAFVKLMGFSEEELAARPCLEFVHPDDRQRTVAEAAAQLVGDGRVRVENRYIRNDGSIVWLSWTMSASGRDILGIARDITAERAIASELVRAKEAAEAASKAKSEFLATMSHEIRTPLNGVIGMADILRSTPLSPAQREQVETIYDSGRMLLTVLNDILDLSRIEAGKLEIERRSFNLGDAVQSLCELWGAAAAQKGLTFSCAIAGGVAQAVAGDEVRVRQVIGNLLSNAVKFTESGGVVLRVGRDQSSGRVRCDVIDTGAGIAADILPRLFEKFSQGDASVTRRHGGTGLGLAISRQLAEMMGGGISVESKAGAGSTFTATFELAPVLDGVPSLPECHLQPSAQRSLNLLVAEDNAVNRKLIKTMLDALGHGCTFAEDGEQAVARASDGGFDAVLMDVQMPVLDGMGATKRIRAFGDDRARVAIIAVTANAMAGDREKYLAAGMDGYVSKPLSVANLAGALDGVKNKLPSAAADVLPGARTHR